MDTLPIRKYLTPVLEFVEQHPRAALCLGVTGLSVGYYVATRERNLPPGPTPLPFVGNLLSMSDRIHIDFMRMRQKYGDILKVYFGSQ